MSLVLIYHLFTFIIPTDLRETLISTSGLIDAWNDLTPLARNEWICWVTSAKKPETRSKRIELVGVELIEGKRRPYCCPRRKHRKK